MVAAHRSRAACRALRSQLPPDRAAAARRGDDRRRLPREGPPARRLVLPVGLSPGLREGPAGSAHRPGDDRLPDQANADRHRRPRRDRRARRRRPPGLRGRLPGRRRGGDRRVGDGGRRAGVRGVCERRLPEGCRGGLRLPRAAQPALHLRRPGEIVDDGCALLAANREAVDSHPIAPAPFEPTPLCRADGRPAREPPPVLRHVRRAARGATLPTSASAAGSRPIR